MIPMIDLNAELNLYRNEIYEAIKEVIESSSFILGEEGRQLENNIADDLGQLSV